MKISIVLPVHNEEKSLSTLSSELNSALSTLGRDHEIIWVNDGSKDGSLEVLKEFAANDSRHKVISFARNFGQTAAMSAGIMAATGDIIIPMDSDLQNDPADIPKFITKIDEGFDVVSGWRRDRQDKAIQRKLPSKIANWLIGVLTGVKIHDYGCSMKAYKREIIQGFTLYGEMHRFIPAYASWCGGKVAEIVVHHRARIHGVAHYGIGRTFKVLLDLVVLKFLTKYMARPMHFFGGIGFVSFGLGMLSGIFAIMLRIMQYANISRTPLPTIAAMFIIVGVQFVLMGVVAEIMIRTYYESQGKTPYTIKDKINFY
jgi:glycosyltransferase involved in cell wall biosynthesis